MLKLRRILKACLGFCHNVPSKGPRRAYIAVLYGVVLVLTERSIMGTVILRNRMSVLYTYTP